MKRSRIGIRISVDDKNIPDRIERAVERAFAPAGREIGKQAKGSARRQIIEKDAIWKGDLLKSFRVQQGGAGNLHVVRISNTSEHAPYVEHGTKVYTRAPPLAKLIPWVETELQGWTVWNGRLIPE